MKILTHARIRSLLPAAFFLLICAGLASCGKVASGANASQKHSQGSQTIPVSVATVQRRDFPVYLNGLGSVKAFNTVALKSRVDGQLVQVAFREGQEVRKGDLLAVIDPGLTLDRGTDSELHRPLGITIVGGLMVSQALTLFTTPVVYLYMDRAQLWARRMRGRAAQPLAPGLGEA